MKVQSVYAPFGDREEALVELYLDGNDQVANYRVFHPHPLTVLQSLNKAPIQSVEAFLQGLR